MRERDIKAAILREFGSWPGLRLFNNPVGEAWMGRSAFQPSGEVVIQHPRKVRFGLAPGSADLIGFYTLVITPEMVGRCMAQFLAVETKGPRGRTTLEQANFLRVVNQSGGMAILARGVEDVEIGLRRLR